MQIKAFVATLLLPAMVHAQEVPDYVLPPMPKLEISAIPEGEDEIVFVAEGAEAPFSGHLYTPETALRWANSLEQYRIKTPLLFAAQREIFIAELNYRDDVLAARQKAALDIQEDLEARILRLEEKNAELQAELSKGPPWYNSRGFGIAVGVVSSIVVTSLSIWAISAAQGN